MSVPEPESAQPAERPATPAGRRHHLLAGHRVQRPVLLGPAAVAGLADRPHPVMAELLNGSTESNISAAAFARAGEGTLAVVLLAAIPGPMKFDPLYW